MPARREAKYTEHTLQPTRKRAKKPGPPCGEERTSEYNHNNHPGLTL